MTTTLIKRITFTYSIIDIYIITDIYILTISINIFSKCIFSTTPQEIHSEYYALYISQVDIYNYYSYWYILLRWCCVVALLQIIGKSNKATRNILFVKYSAYRRAVFIPQLVSYLLQGLPLLAHGAGKFSPLVALEEQRWNSKEERDYRDHKDVREIYYSFLIE